jgi:pimeloyl-ACP methyl ester carboxylesterase
MTSVIKYRGQYQFAFTEFGDRAGYPILVQHGLIASIHDKHLFDRLVRMGAHLVCIARPGYGASSPYAMKCIAEWGQIVNVVVEGCAFSRFDVLGISSGAPYSYAIGSHMADRVRNIFILSGIPALFDEQVLRLWPYPVDKDASIDELKQLAYDLFFSNVADQDRHRDPIADSMQNGCFGIAQDLKLRCIDWGFDMSRVHASVYMQHSKGDSQVPVRTAELTAGMLSNCRLEIRDGSEHFSESLLDEFVRRTMTAHYLSNQVRLADNSVPGAA